MSPKLWSTRASVRRNQRYVPGWVRALHGPRNRIDAAPPRCVRTRYAQRNGRRGRRRPFKIRLATDWKVGPPRRVARSVVTTCSRPAGYFSPLIKS